MKDLKKLPKRASYESFLKEMEMLRKFEREKVELQKKSVKVQSVLFGLLCADDNHENIASISSSMRSIFEYGCQFDEEFYALYEYVQYAQRHPKLNLSYEKELEILRLSRSPFFKTYAQTINSERNRWRV